jgi:hypothetical protein
MRWFLSSVTCAFSGNCKRLLQDSAQPDDRLLMACIRRLNLDAFWSRASPTVHGNRDQLIFGIKMSTVVGLHGPNLHDGPMPSYDHCGYKVAIQMLLHSRHPGRYSKDHVQLDTIRKLRTCHGNQVGASPQANKQTLSLGNQKGRYQWFFAPIQLPHFGSTVSLTDAGSEWAKIGARTKQ